MTQSRAAAPDLLAAGSGATTVLPAMVWYPEQREVMTRQTGVPPPAVGQWECGTVPRWERRPPVGRARPAAHAETDYKAGGCSGTDTHLPALPLHSSTPCSQVGMKSKHLLHLSEPRSGHLIVLSHLAFCIHWAVQ